MAQVAEEPMDPRMLDKDIRAATAELVLRTLAKDPQSRPTTSAFVQSLKELLAQAAAPA